ncbi:peptidase M20D [Xylariaceae sp. FL1651]|nr:peptidase M20D [Xylariaceae sp. FL1651]
MASFFELVNQHRPDLTPFVELYKHFHANPELSNYEKETAARVAEELRAISSDFVIKTGIGGHGIAAILTNNSGPVVLLRADMDALPVQEQTSLPYASTKFMAVPASSSSSLDRSKEEEFVRKPVMHACGHDMHMTALLAAAKILVSARGAWSGALVLVFQPAEERGTGAQAMVDDGLYSSDRHGVPIPDVVVAGHVIPLRAGTVGTRRGIAATSADSMRVTLKGRGAHASMPHAAVDPIVLAAHTVLRLQSVVSRETDPADSTCVTVASVRAGEAENVIPDRATLALDWRAISEVSRKRVGKRVREICRAESRISWGEEEGIDNEVEGGGVGGGCSCHGSGGGITKNAPWEPDFEVTRAFPLTINDDAVLSTLEERFRDHFGGYPDYGSGKAIPPESHYRYDADTPRLAASEDFSILASAVGKPYCFFVYGGTDPLLMDDAVKKGRVAEDIPINHSSKFAPVVMPTLRAGMEAYVIAALAFLKRAG